MSLVSLEQFFLPKPKPLRRPVCYAIQFHILLFSVIKFLNLCRLVHKLIRPSPALYLLFYRVMQRSAGAEAADLSDAGGATQARWQAANIDLSPQRAGSGLSYRSPMEGQHE